MNPLQQYEDTIIAVATPPGVGAVALIRVSGKNAIIEVDKFFRGKLKLIESHSHTLHYGKFVDRSENTIDDVLVSVFKEPNSYTGENVIEISTHGNPLITGDIIKVMLSENIRNAEPGEFTRRAYLNNRLDLVQAEAVSEIINARTETALRGARNQLDGLLSSRVQYLRDQLINTSSLLELELDFAEEDLEFVDRSVLIENIEMIIRELNDLISTYNFGRIIRDGVFVALVGKPNVGKSSLLNYLLKESRAIVSEIPGTTRDIIREEISINGILFHLHDTAGIRLTEDEIEKEGVARSREAVKQADIVLLIDDVVNGESGELYNELLTIVDKTKILRLLNKCDIHEFSSDEEFIKTSAKTGEGIQKLLTEMQKMAAGENIYTEKSAVVTSIRHFRCLEKAVVSLNISLDACRDGLSSEFVSIDLRAAASSLAEIIGTVSSADILNNIFEKFCIGK